MTGSSPSQQEPRQPQEPLEPIEAEVVPPAAASPTAALEAADEAAGYDERGVPSFDYVRDKIEGRYATSLGSTELAEGSPQARSLDEQQAERDRAAAAKLDEIRRSLGQ